MWNAVLVGAAAIAIAGSSIVLAQPMEKEGEREQGPRVSQEDRDAFSDRRLDSRLAWLKQRLRLTPEQERNWPAYESAVQALAQQHRERMQSWHEQGRASDPVQRMRRRADALSSMGAALSRLAEAQGPLYGSLDEDQKRRFATLREMLGDHHDMHHRWRDGDDDDDRRGWRGRDDDRDRRGWRDRDYDDRRRAWRGREDDGDRRGWRDRDYDDDRRSWRGRGDDADRPDWRGREDDDDDDDDED
jgi:hypothetical protein